MSNRILCVDLDANTLQAVGPRLHDLFQIEFASCAQSALELLIAGRCFDVVLAEAHVLEEVQRCAPQIVRIALVDESTAANAQRAHPYRTLKRPCDALDLTDALRSGLEQHRRQLAEHKLLEDTLTGSIKVLVEMLALTEPHFFRHCAELELLAGRLARELAVPKPWEVDVAAMLGSLGAVTVPLEVIGKVDADRPLKPNEQLVYDAIPAAGAGLLENIPHLEGVAEIVEAQSRDYSPEAPDALPMGARILRVLNDMFELEDRGELRSQALEKLMQRSHVYDPVVLELVVERLGQVAHEPAAVDISFNSLRPGHVLAAPLMSTAGRQILGAGQRIGSVLLTRLRNLHEVRGLQEPVSIEDC